MTNINENNNNVKIGYKVATRVNSKAFKPATNLALQSFRYRLGQTTRRDADISGAIAIFDTLEAAEKFWKRYGTAVLEVEYEASDERELWKKNPPNFVRNRYGKGYHAESAGITSLDEDDCPDGTIFAEAITPIRIVCED